MENPIAVTRITRGFGAAARCPGAPERVRLAFRNAALWGAADLAKPGIEERRYKHQELANQYGIPEALVRALLVAWDVEGLIAIRCWDGERLRPCRQWKQTDDMFFNTGAGGYIRVRLLPAGAALVEGQPRAVSLPPKKRRKRSFGGGSI